MNILFIGDIFGKKGIQATKNELPKIKREYAIDFCIANAENVTNCRGLNYHDYEYLSQLGIDFFTMGNHTWKNEEIIPILKNQSNIIRPYNVNAFNYQNVGKGFNTITIREKTIRIINLLGTSVFLRNGKINNPFLALEEILSNEEKVDLNIVDFHAETTSEKNCMLRIYGNKVSAILGTHTHVQTNDACIYKNTAYITDVGMCGPSDGIIGASKESLIQMFLGVNKQFKLSEELDGGYQFCAVYIKFDDLSNLPVEIKNIYIWGK